MTIDEAIRRLEQHKCYLESINAHEQIEAHQLGIEALKKIKLWRQDNVYPDYTLLPGETEE